MENTIAGPEPLWYKDAVIYELHVKAFFDGNNDGLGDFPGLVSKLEYLRDLGVTCLWLLPFYPSPLKDDGYDISDYEGIHPAYGTMDDFRAFVRKAHEYGFRVVTELVLNHTSDQHPWFQKSRSAPPGSSERNFYVWSDTDRKYGDARIIFGDSEKSNWTWDPVAKQYFWHRFFRHQPDLNYDNPAVRDAIMRVMQHWLDMGVDGLRLDAVPYLVERDATSCENLAETHEILKEMRRKMDERYAGRMLLAEANQWPADVLPYFGEGDECHMAFHFPLMPRLFMALRQEDRHPITEIMRQTPRIPESCQWALFLRNHDELTLEMVTDEERDYMYYEYANDPIMRINLGIKRRLAPLLEGSSRRIELLYGFLFSFPGTPIIYYGDEIGMGDNVYLGDRNGVRTPMQWTGDRNGGFSRADPARLYCPPVMDPVYGYQAVNVESQERDPSSLLVWMKRMIALRKRLKVMSRGSLEFVFPQNRKVIAYVREYEDEVVLAVANLSRFVQPAELDLARFKGHTPIELIGKAELPQIREHPYFLTLSPHSFMWFHLRRETQSVSLVRGSSFDDLPEIVLEKKGVYAGLFKGNAKRRLEVEILPGFIARQRWFGSKSRKLASVRIADWGELRPEGRTAFIVIVDVELSRGSTGSYLIPLSVLSGNEAEETMREYPASVAARIRAESELIILCDAMFDAIFRETLFDAISRSSEIGLQKSIAKAGAAASFKEIFRPFDTLPFKSRILQADQSNTSVMYGERFILKLFRKIQAGINPEYEIGLYLTEKTGFKHVPRTAGGITCGKPGEPGVTLAVIHEYLENQGSGWLHTQSALGRYFENVRIRAQEDVPREVASSPSFGIAGLDASPLAMETIGPYLNTAAVLGKRTAELHLILSRNTGDPFFSPEPLNRDYLSAMTEGMRESAYSALRLLEGGLDRIPESVRDRAHGLLGMRSRLIDMLKPPEMPAVPGGRIRCHGDFHLGQLLWVENDFVILDFEGEPSRSIPERRAKQSPLKDVAGMLGSFEYAVQSALLSYAQDSPFDISRLSQWAVFWRKHVSAQFLRSYLAGAGGAIFLPENPAHVESLLNLFCLDKTFYELCYELDNRPDWVSIPIDKLMLY